MSRGRLAEAALPLAIAGGLAAVFGGAAALNYDTEYALLWGRDLVDGRLPDYDVAFAPTPHPLATAFGALLALTGWGGVPFGEAAESAWLVTAFLALGVLGWLVFALGREWFAWPVGALAAAIVLTREPVLSFGVRAYVDVPYLCLLLAALLVETRRRRAGTPVLVLLTLAGLLRPEAWLFAALYAAWLWRGGRLRPAHVVLAAAAPVLWALSDLAVTGDLLHSLTGTRETGAELGRVTGLDDLPVTGPRRLGEIVREPVLVGAAGGGLLALWRLRERAELPALAGVVAVLAFCVLAAAGLPLITRYLLAPAVIVAVFCAAGALGWLALDRDDPWRRRWAAFGALVAVLLVAFAPSQTDRLERLDRSLSRQAAILDELRSFFPDEVPARCRPFTLPNRRAIPQLAIWTGTPPGQIRSAQDDGIAGTYFAPSSRAVAEQFVLDRRDRERALPAPPAGAPAIRGRYWHVYRRCR